MKNLFFVKIKNLYKLGKFILVIFTFEEKNISRCNFKFTGCYS